MLTYPIPRQDVVRKTRLALPKPTSILEILTAFETNTSPKLLRQPPPIQLEGLPIQRLGRPRP